MVGPQFKLAGQQVQRFLATHRPQDLISNFNTLLRPPRAPSGMVPNHWNISIRRVALSPSGDLVFLVQPDTDYVHQEGPIQIVEGQPPGYLLKPKSVTLQTIAKLIIKAFVEGTGTDIIPSAPWLWKTNDTYFARRIVKIMTDMGVREDLMNTTVADPDELAVCDQSWRDLNDRMNGLMAGNVRRPAGI